MKPAFIKIFVIVILVLISGVLGYLILSKTILKPSRTEIAKKKIEVVQKFKTSTTDYKSLVDSLTFNKELIAAIKKNPKYGDYPVAHPYPNFATMNDQQVVVEYKKYIMGYWDEGIAISGQVNMDGSLAINSMLFSLYALTQWGQSAYISEDALPSWQNAFNTGKDSIYTIIQNLDQPARGEMEDYLDELFLAPHYSSFSNGRINKDLPLMDGVPVARK